MKKLDTIQKYGMVDILFAILYLFVFIYIIPAHDTFAFSLTVGIPVILLLGGIYMIFKLKYSYIVSISLAWLFLAISFILIFLLAYTIGYFKGIYGPLGKGITIISYLSIIFVIQLFSIWPIFQLRAFWRRKISKNRKPDKKNNKKEHNDIEKAVKNGKNEDSEETK